MFIEYKSKKLPKSGFKLLTLCRLPRCFNHCASSIIVIDAIVIVYVYCCTVRLALCHSYSICLLLYSTSGWGTASPPAPAMMLPGLASTWICGEAGPGSLGGADVEAVLRPDGQGGRAHNLKGGWLLCN
jgi:hypothetical protein